MTSPTYFLSYSRLDEGPALRFAAGLRAAGLSIWVDQWDIRPSQHWDRAIEQAVRACAGLLVLLSPNSTASENVADEISFALENGKKVIPILLERCAVPLRVTRMQLIDATSDLDRAVRSCVDEINGASDRTRPEPAVARPPQVDAAAAARVEARLRPWVGPMAGVLVSRAASSARSEAELHAAVARHITEPRARARFEALSGTPPPTGLASEASEASQAAADAGGVGGQDVERLASLLVAYLGPMAPAVTRRESRRASSALDLATRLSELIADPTDRARFLRQSADAGGGRGGETRA